MSIQNVNRMFCYELSPSLFVRLIFIGRESVASEGPLLDRSWINKKIVVQNGTLHFKRFLQEIRRQKLRERNPQNESGSLGSCEIVKFAHF